MQFTSKIIYSLVPKLLSLKKVGLVWLTSPGLNSIPTLFLNSQNYTRDHGMHTRVNIQIVQCACRDRALVFTCNLKSTICALNSYEEETETHPDELYADKPLTCILGILVSEMVLGVLRPVVSWLASTEIV